MLIPDNSVLLLSGGVDSLVLLATACDAGKRPVRCVSFDYGQRHSRETLAAVEFAALYGVPWELVKISPETLSGSALTGGCGVPTGIGYDNPAQSVTVVPNRNLTFISLAAAVAKRYGAECVMFGAHAGDAAVYPDCRKLFVDAANAVTLLACGIRVEAPFLQLVKTEIIRLGQKLSAPIHRAWSCYLGGEKPCGSCGACLERNEAIKAASENAK